MTPEQKARVSIDAARVTICSHHLQPISVAEWETQLTRALPQELEGSLPTIEQIEAELSGDNR